MQNIICPKHFDLNNFQKGFKSVDIHRWIVLCLYIEGVQWPVCMTAYSTSKLNNI